MKIKVKYTNESKELFERIKEKTLIKNLITKERNLKQVCKLYDVRYIGG